MPIDPAIAQQLQLLLKVALAMLLGSVIGMAVALGQLVLAIGATLLVLLTLRSIRWLE